MYTNKEISSNFFYVNGKKSLKETVVNVKRTDGKMIDPTEIMDICESLAKKATYKYDFHKLRVRGKGITQWFTFKGYDDEDLNIQTIEEYLRGRVADTEKFGKLYELELTMVRTL